MNEKTTEKGTGKTLRIVCWFLFGLFGLSAVSVLPMKPYFAVVYLVWALMFFPPLHRWTEQYGRSWNFWGRFVPFVLVLSLTSLQADPNQMSQDIVANPTPSITPKVAASFSSPTPSPAVTPSPVTATSPATAPNLSTESSPVAVPKTDTPIDESAGYRESCQEGITAHIKNLNFSMSKLADAYEYKGFFGITTFSERICAAAENMDAKLPPRAAGVKILETLGEAYFSRGEIVRPMVNRY
jgi:hypothetical protein